MRMSHQKLFILAALIVLAGCDQKSGSHSIFQADDEAAALAAPQFTAPIMLHLSSDTYAAAQVAAAMHGNSPIYPPESHTVGINLTPCRDTEDHFWGDGINFSAGIGFYNFTGDTVALWLAKKGILDIQRYPIRHSMPEDRDYGKVSTFICPVVTENLRQYLPPEQRAVDIHGGLDVPLLKRTFVAWTYRNRYETQIPGMGTIKVFAGTFTYSLESIIPGATSTGVGTASVKAVLNPDTGHWQADSYQGQDPPVTLQ